MNNRQTLFVVLTFIALLATMLTHQFGSRRYQRLTDARTKADEHREALMNLRLCIVDAETGFRGYLLADNAWYKETYTKAVNTLPDLLLQVQLLYEREEVEELFRLVKLRMSFLYKGILLQEKGLKEEAITFVKTDEGKRVMDLFRDEVARMKAEVKAEEKKVEKEFKDVSGILLNGLGLMHLIVIVLVAILMIPESALKEIIRDKGWK